MYWVLKQVDGYSDPYYLRINSPKQTALILGTSRAAMGLHPTTLNTSLNRTDIYNFSFTLLHSPYGPTYFNSIQHKIKPKTKDGLFLLAVDPWSISSICDNPNDTLLFREQKSFLAHPLSYDKKPNFNYLLKRYEGYYITFLFPFLTKKKTFLHEDGWLETFVGMKEEEVKKRTTVKTKDYQKNRLKYKFSETRLLYLKKTINFLKNHGTVYLLRLPVSSQIMKIENELLPHFEQVMQSVTNEQQVIFLDLTHLNNQCKFTDGNHLFKTSAIEVSKILAQSIKEKE